MTLDPDSQLTGSILPAAPAARMNLAVLADSAVAVIQALVADSAVAVANQVASAFRPASCFKFHCAAHSDCLAVRSVAKDPRDCPSASGAAGVSVANHSQHWPSEQASSRQGPLQVTPPS